MMSSYDSRWEEIVNIIENCKNKVIDDGDIEAIAKELKWDEDTKNKAMKILYTTLIQYTKGDAKVKVTTGGIKSSFDSYRHISHKGKNATIQAQMHRRIKVMNPDAAKSVAEVEAKMNNWKMIHVYCQNYVKIKTLQ